MAVETGPIVGGRRRVILVWRVRWVYRRLLPHRSLVVRGEGATEAMGGGGGEEVVGEGEVVVIQV